MHHAFREALAAIRRSPLLVGVSIVAVSLSLFVVGLFALAAYNVRSALRGMEERVEVVQAPGADATAEPYPRPLDHRLGPDHANDRPRDLAHRVPQFGGSIAPTRSAVNAAAARGWPPPPRRSMLAGRWLASPGVSCSSWLSSRR